MKKAHKQERKMKGVALIVVIGILSLLVIIGTYFAINMQLEQKAAANFLNSIKAKYLAEMGIQKTIADIRNHVKSDSYDDLIDYIQNYNTSEQEVTDIGTYQIFIGKESANVGEDEKINLNALNNTDSTAIDTLKNTLGLSDDDIAAIIDYKDADTDETTSLYTSGGWVNCTGNETNVKNLPFTTLEEIKLVSDNIDDKYDNIKDDLTIFGPIIRGGLLAEYYNDITGASPNVSIDESSFVGKVVELGEVCRYHWEGDELAANGVNSGETVMPGADGWWDNKGWIETDDASWAGSYLLSGVDSWGAPHGIVTTCAIVFKGYIEILPDEVGSVTFYLRSDDGSRLYIDGEEVVDYWSEHAMEEKSGSHTFDYAGWHSIKIEYYENGSVNGLELTWNLDDGSTSPDGSGKYVPAERLGYRPLIAHPIEADITYNSAGSYKIISLARVETSGGKILAEKKISGIFKIFGTWTQTTKEEFYGAWFNDYDNYADGEIRNVNWLNSCPLDSTAQTMSNAVKLGYWDDFDEDLAYSALMLEGTWNVYIDYPDASYGVPGWNNLPWVAHAWSASFGEELVEGDPTTQVSNFGDFDGDGDDEFRIVSQGGYDTDYEPWGLNAENKHAEINYKYYQSTSDFDYDIFAESFIAESQAPAARHSWEGDGTVSSNTKYNGIPTSYTYKYWYDDENGNWQWDFTDANGDGTYQVGELCEPWPVYKVWDASGNPVDIYNPVDNPGGAYWHSEAPWIVGWWWIRITSGSTGSYSPVDGTGNHPYVKVLIKDEDGQIYTDGDKCEMSADNFYITGNETYDTSKIMTIIGAGSNYRSFVDGVPKTGTRTHSGFDSAIGLLNNNLFSLVAWDWNGAPPHLPPAPYPYVAPPAEYADDAVNLHGSNTDLDVYWDDIRVIFESGHLVSTPLFAGYDPEVSSSDITWGTISYTSQAPSNTDVNVCLRAANSKSNLPTTDTGWSSAVTDGQSISDISGDWLQYKVELSTSAISTGDYSGSKATPYLEDVTITYLPRVEVLSWKEETE